MIAKIKNFVKQRGIIIGKIFLIILSLSASFFSGIIIGGKLLNRPPLIIEKTVLSELPSVSTSISEKPLTKGLTKGMFVASKRGKYYYPVDCYLANTLSEKNKIYFNSRAEAEKQGYIFNSRCR